MRACRGPIFVSDAAVVAESGSVAFAADGGSDGDNSTVWTGTPDGTAWNSIRLQVPDGATSQWVDALMIRPAEIFAATSISTDEAFSVGIHRIAAGKPQLVTVLDDVAPDGYVEALYEDNGTPTLQVFAWEDDTASTWQGSLRPIGLDRA